MSLKLFKPLTVLFTFGGCSLLSAATPSDMPVNTWLSVPNTKMSSVYAFVPNLTANGGISGVLSWSGGTFDTKRNRLIVWGGGHWAYLGNEVYAFDVDALTWERVTNPTINPNLCNQVNGDGTPNSRHTYNGLAFIEDADRFFAVGGSEGCRSGSCGMDITWTFDFDTKKWKNMSPSGTRPKTGCEDVCSYDPGTKKVYFSDKSGMYSYSYSANQWTRLSSSGHTYATSAMDTKRGNWVFVGKDGVFGYNVRSGSLSRKNYPSSGLSSGGTPGFKYDPTTDKFVGWNGGNTIHILDAETMTWSSKSPSGGPAQTGAGGAYGRWQYAPSVNAFVAVGDAKADVHFYKFSAGPGTSVEKSKKSVSERGFRVSPNPFKTVVRFEAQQKAVFKIFDSGGRNIKTLSPPLTTWDASKMAPGIYLVKGVLGKKRFTEKLILSR